MPRPAQRNYRRKMCTHAGGLRCPNNGMSSFRNTIWFSSSEFKPLAFQAGALPPNAIITNLPAKATRIIYPGGVKKISIWHPPPGTPQQILLISELEDLSSYDPYKPQPNVVKAQIASVTLNLPFTKLEPVPIDERVLPHTDAQEHKLYNHLRMCKDCTKQHTMPPSLWTGERSKISIVLDRICPHLPPIDKNKLKGKKVYLDPMPTPSKMGIRSYPNMTHKKYQKSMYAREYTKANAEQYYQQWIALLHLEANKEELKEVTDNWLKTPVSWWCKNIKPRKPGDPLPKNHLKEKYKSECKIFEEVHKRYQNAEKKDIRATEVADKARVDADLAKKEKSRESGGGCCDSDYNMRGHRDGDERPEVEMDKAIDGGGQ
ncbi:hypothetical protein Fmac_015154 [Flemingia macrophylla]|uniref:Uncharacterized protein n=1 Tax=Flemingia macrophylla TaxID=520843 RepID=A0ABD1MDR4_9FABA